MTSVAMARESFSGKTGLSSTYLKEVRVPTDGLSLPQCFRTLPQHFFITRTTPRNAGPGKKSLQVASPSVPNALSRALTDLFEAP